MKHSKKHPAVHVENAKKKGLKLKLRGLAICSKFSACPYMRSDWRFGEVL